MNTSYYLYLSIVIYRSTSILSSRIHFLFYKFYSINLRFWKYDMLKKPREEYDARWRRQRTSAVLLVRTDPRGKKETHYE